MSASLGCGVKVFYRPSGSGQFKVLPEVKTIGDIGNEKGSSVDVTPLDSCVQVNIPGLPSASEVNLTLFWDKNLPEHIQMRDLSETHSDVDFRVVFKTGDIAEYSAQLGSFLMTDPNPGSALEAVIGGDVIKPVVWS